MSSVGGSSASQSAHEVTLLTGAFERSLAEDQNTKEVQPLPGTDSHLTFLYFCFLVSQRHH